MAERGAGATAASAVSAARRAAPALLVVVTLLVLAFLYRTAELVLVFFIAALLGVYLTGFTDLLCRKTHLPRVIGLVLAVALTLALLAGVVVLLAPAVTEQTMELIVAVPRYLEAMDNRLSAFANSYEVLRRTGIASAETGILTSSLRQLADFISTSVLEYATVTGKIIIDGVAVLVMAVYLALRPAIYRQGVVQLVPPVHRPVAVAIVKDLGATLRSWVGAQLLAMVVLALLTGLGLWILDVPYWLAFSIFTGIAVMVPFFGTIVSTLLPALLILGERGILAFFLVAMVGVIVHLVEANVVHPIIMQHRVALPPVLTILSVLVMGKLAGLLGLVVAVPMLATAIVVVRHVLIYQTYGEQPIMAVAPPPAVLQPSRKTPLSSPAVRPPDATDSTAG